MADYPIKLTIKDLPSRVEVRRGEQVRSVSTPHQWKKLTDMIGKQIKAGGMVEVDHRRVQIAKGHPAYGQYITEVVDVRFEP